MDTIVFGTFATQKDAERCVHELQSELEIPRDDISYLYRDSDENMFEIYDGQDIVGGSVTGAAVGVSLGTLVGLATVAGVIPFMGPVFVAGPLISALGFGASAVATTAVGAVTGAVTGGLIGALVEWGVPSDVAESYEDRLNSGEILVSVSTDTAAAAERKFDECNATSISTHATDQSY